MEKLTRAEVVGVQGDTVGRMVEITPGTYPTITFVDTILDRKCDGRPSINCLEHISDNLSSWI